VITANDKDTWTMELKMYTEIEQKWKI